MWSSLLAQNFGGKQMDKKWGKLLKSEINCDKMENSIQQCKFLSVFVEFSKINLDNFRIYQFVCRNDYE